MPFCATIVEKPALVVSLFVVLVIGSLEGQAAEKVGALGRIQAGNGQVYLTGADTDIIAEILVQQDEFVTHGTPVAILQSKALYETEVRLAEIERESAEKLGTEAIALQTLKIEECGVQGTQAIALQELEVKKAQADVKIAQKRLTRVEQVGETYSSQDIETAEYSLETARLTADAAQQELARLQAEHAIGLEVARRELQRLTQERAMNSKEADQNLALVRERLRTATILAPIDGTILEVSRHAGEVVGTEPMMVMADLQQMFVIGEIFESDVLKIDAGMRATITSKALPEPLIGQVESIGRVLSPQSKVADVKIRLHDTEIASRLLNLEVNISIETRPP